MPTTRGRGDYITTGDKLKLRDGSTADNEKSVTIQSGDNNQEVVLKSPSDAAISSMPDGAGDDAGKKVDELASLAATQTLTNKALTSPKLNEGDALTATSTELNQIAGVSVGGNDAGDIVTTDDVQTLTNKSIDASANPITNITNGSIDNNAAIVDTKLDTISTAGKVANSATTATDNNTPFAIVARDASGNFSAETITAAIVGNASTATTLQTSRSIALSGELSGSTSFNGSADVSISATVVDNVIDNANIKTNAGIARTKIAAGTANQVVINDGSGVFSSEAQLSISRGGTGASSAPDAFDALSPLTTKGDILVRTGSINGPRNVRLPVGINNYVLAADSTAASGVAWKSAASVNTFVNPLTTEGDIIYSSGGDTPERLAIGGLGEALGITEKDPASSSMSKTELSFGSTGISSSSYAFAYSGDGSTFAECIEEGFNTTLRVFTREGDGSFPYLPTASIYLVEPTPGTGLDNVIGFGCSEDGSTIAVVGYSFFSGEWYLIIYNNSGSSLTLDSYKVLPSSGYSQIRVSNDHIVLVKPFTSSVIAYQKSGAFWGSISTSGTLPSGIDNFYITKNLNYFVCNSGYSPVLKVFSYTKATGVYAEIASFDVSADVTTFYLSGVCISEDGTHVLVGDASYSSTGGVFVYKKRPGLLSVTYDYNQTIVDSTGTSPQYGQYIGISDDNSIIALSSKDFSTPEYRLSIAVLNALTLRYEIVSRYLDTDDSLGTIPAGNSFGNVIPFASNNTFITSDTFTGNASGFSYRFEFSVIAAIKKLEYVPHKNRWQKKTLTNNVAFTGFIDTVTGNDNFQFSNLVIGRYYELKVHFDFVLSGISPEAQVVAKHNGDLFNIGVYEQSSTSLPFREYKIGTSYIFKAEVPSLRFYFSKEASGLLESTYSYAILTERNDLIDEVDIW